MGKSVNFFNAKLAAIVRRIYKVGYIGQYWVTHIKDITANTNLRKLQCI